MFKSIVASKRGSKSTIRALQEASDDSILLETEEDWDDMARQFEEGCIVQDRKYRLRTYPSCFVAREAVDFIVQSGLAVSRQQAVELGRELARRFNLFEHVCRDHEFKDEYLFFRFVPKKKRLLSIENLEILDLHHAHTTGDGDNSTNDEYSHSSSTTTHTTVGALGIDDVEEAFERGVEVKDRRYHLRVYPQCFVANEAVSYLVKSGYAKTREQAVMLGMRLQQERNLIRHVTDDHLFKDEYLFFVFIPQEERVVVEPTQKQSLQEIAEKFHRGIKVKDRKYRLKTYKQVFIASKSVDWLIRYRMANSRREAVEIGQALCSQMNLFQHVTNDHDFCDDYLFFRFQPSSEWKPVEQQANGNADEEAVDPKLRELADLFRRGVKVQTNRYHGRKYRFTFVGSEAVDFLVNSSQASTRRGAVELGRRLAKELNLFDHVYGEHEFCDDYKFYRFAGDDPKRRISGMTSVSGLSDLSSSSLSLDKMAQIFRRGVGVKDRRYHLRVYRDCFVGSEAVDFLVGSTLADSRMEAVDIGRTLAREFNLFEHVTRDHEFKDQYLFYRMVNLDKIRAISEIAIEESRLLEMAKLFEAGIDVKDHRHRMRVFHNSFEGKEAVNFLVKSGMATSRNEAVQIGRAFAKEFNLIEHVTRDHLFSDEPLYFRFLSLGQRKAWFEDESVHRRSALPELVVYSDDEEWVRRVKEFETRVLLKLQRVRNRNLPRSPSYCSDDGIMSTSDHVKCWAGELRRLDPRYQILAFFNDVAHEGANNIERTDLNSTLTRPMLRYFPRASVFTIWRPTSFDAIRKMMLGLGVGKGLDIKGKSARRGKLKSFVPFLQISENKHKRRIRTLPRDGTVRLFFKSDARRSRDIVAETLEEVAEEMMQIVKEARRVLADDKADSSSHKDAMDSMLLDMSNPSISYIDNYAPQCYGLDIPVRLLWEVFYERQDCSRKPGSEYDIGRPSQPAFQDMNFAALRCTPNEGSPRVVLMQNADADSPMNPFEILMAYEDEQNGQVLPVVSDFDCFLVGTRGVRYSSPLPSCQLETLMQCVSRIENILDDSSPELEHANWTTRWLDVLEKDDGSGVSSHKTPMFGFGDQKSYSIMKNAVERLKLVGAVRHGSESFNYTFPQELDEEFLVISDALPGDMPWQYMNVSSLQEFLSERIDEGFTFPLHVKWILCDQRWKPLYDKLLSSDKKNVQDSMNIWFPPVIRKKIEDIHERHPYGLDRLSMIDNFNQSMRRSDTEALADIYLNKFSQDRDLSRVGEEVECS